MTEKESHSERLVDNSSRRGFIKKGALTSSVLALGLGDASSVAAQDSGDNTTQNGGRNALMANEKFRPGALFRVKSPALNQDPGIEGVQRSEYNTRRIEYLNTDEMVHFFPAQDVQLQEGELYRFNSSFGLVNNITDASVISVSFESFPEQITGNDNQLGPGDGLEIIEGGGNAVVSIDNFNAGALILITTDVIEKNPNEVPENYRSNYDSRLVEFLNTGEDFLVYPAHDAEVEEGAVYMIDNEFDIVHPDENLVITKLNRVNQDDIPDGYV